MRAERRRLCVIGVGNAARGDDVVGLLVARRLRHLRSAGVTVREAGGEGTVLMEAWRDAELVIVIDAVCSGAPPGTVHRLDMLAPAMPSGMLKCSTHAFGVAEAVALARVLNQFPPRGILYGVEGRSFELGGAPSVDVQRAVPGVVARVLHDLARFGA